MRIARDIPVATALGWVGCKGGAVAPPGAALFFDVDFSSPENELGEAPTVHPDGTAQPFPANRPSQIFLGPPKVVEAACGLEGHPGLEFLLEQRYGHSHVELDLCDVEIGVPPLQASEPQLAIFLDIPDAYALDFDLATQSWSIGIDGAKIFDGKLEALIPRAVRIVMRADQANAAAIDNVVIRAENHLTEGEQELTPPRTGTNE